MLYEPSYYLNQPDQPGKTVKIAFSHLPIGQNIFKKNHLINVNISKFKRFS